MTSNQNDSRLVKALKESLPEARLGSLPAIISSFVVPVAAVITSQILGHSVSYSSWCALIGLILVYVGVFLWKLLVGIPMTELKADVASLKHEVARTSALSPHDVALYQTFVRDFAPSTAHFLHGEPFHGKVHISQLDPISDFVYGWNGPTFSFHDPIMNEKLQAAITDALKFEGASSLKLFPSTLNPEVMTPYLNGETPSNVSKQTRKNIELLNRLGVKLAQAADAVIREGIARGQTPLRLVA